METISSLSVAEFLTQKIHLSGKTQVEISEEIGYPKPNIMTMFKQGRTRLPITKVVPMARALNIDSIHLLRVVMNEYSPETWEALEEILGAGSMITENELDIIKQVRSASDGENLSPKSEDERREFSTMVQKWKKQIPKTLTVI